eukprot:CAMPEP_0171615338 /NCGR_PEP_ID=MMETSP0990-20121206/12836_1 /TAXON_ID=483369 /ORGANISM="non described non described, Strain CCMP2098" /LENGTH=39 /DNA_ID= /DNA_START= /DNA_END= /DNA_ORIENTATION=
MTLVLAGTPSVDPFSMSTAGPAAVATAQLAVAQALAQPL